MFGDKKIFGSPHYKVGEFFEQFSGSVEILCGHAWSKQSGNSELHTCTVGFKIPQEQFAETIFIVKALESFTPGNKSEETCVKGTFIALLWTELFFIADFAPHQVIFQHNQKQKQSKPNFISSIKILPDMEQHKPERPCYVQRKFIFKQSHRQRFFVFVEG